jgi:hypothetical protein
MRRCAPPTGDRRDIGHQAVSCEVVKHDQKADNYRIYTQRATPTSRWVASVLLLATIPSAPSSSSAKEQRLLSTSAIVAQLEISHRHHEQKRPCHVLWRPPPQPFQPVISAGRRQWLNLPHAPE